MHPDAERYLREYAALLDSITSESQLFDKVPDWQWERIQSSEQRRAVLALNESLSLRGRGQLQPDHPPTTAVGRLSRLVIVSANPGFHADRNQREQLHRLQSKANNANFLRNIFEQLPTVSADPTTGRGRTTPYWTKALLVSQAAFPTGHAPLTGLPLWNAAAAAAARGMPDLCLGGLDLFPFHSTSDHITPLMHGPRANDLLRMVGASTLRMLLKLPLDGHADSHAEGQPARPIPRRVVLVCSPAGDHLVTELASGLLHNWEACGTTSWRMYRAHARSGNSVVVRLPYQVFAQGFPKDWDSFEFAKAIADAASYQAPA